MRIKLALGLCLLFSASVAMAAGNNHSQAKVFKFASPSIVVTEAINQSSKVIAQGSGVVIHKGVVVSNCRVAARSQNIVVHYGNKIYPAVLRYAAPAHSLCSFTVKGLLAPAIQLGVTSDLKVGDLAYIVGAPKGPSLSIIQESVFGLHKKPDGVIVQIISPIPLGSSGGGLFGSHARLIGITSSYRKAGKRVGYAVPVKWIKELPQHGKTLKELHAEQAEEGTQRLLPSAEFQQGIGAFLNGDYATELSVFVPLAKNGNPEAQFQLAWLYGNGQGVPQNYSKAVYWYGKAAAQGNINAMANLGALYVKGKGAPRDYAKAVRWYRKAAVRGDPHSQTALGEMYGKGQGVPQSYRKALDWFRKAAAQDDPYAQNDLGVAYASGQSVPQNYTKAVYWFRKAALQGNANAENNLSVAYTNASGVPRNYRKALYWARKAAVQGLAAAQNNLGVAYGLGRGVPQDFVKSAKWFMLAQKGGYKKSSNALYLLKTHMTSKQIVEAQRLLREWLAKHHKQ